MTLRRFNALLMQALLIFSLLTFVNCKYVDTSLTTLNANYISLLKENCGENYFHPTKILIMFAKLTPPEIGVCYRNNHNITVLLDELTWITANNNLRYQLFMHEASHCYLGIDHSEDKYNYMYYEVIHILSNETVLNQTLNDIKKSCNK